MALIPKKKKSESLKNDSSGFDAQWKVYNDRQEFSLNVDGKDISARVAVELRENDDLLVFDYKTLTYFLLPKFNEVEENVLYGVNGQKALHGIAVIVYDDQKKCDVYLNGKEIGDNTKPFILHGDLIIWIDPESDYFYVILSEGYKNNMLIIPDKMNFPNDLLWTKYEDNTYKLYEKGKMIDGTSLNNAWNGSDAVVYQVERARWLYFPDFEHASLRIPYAAYKLDIDSEKLWSKQSEKDYCFFEKGKNIVDDVSSANIIGNDSLLYVSREKTHYLLVNFINVPLYDLYTPVGVYSDFEAVWLKPAENKFQLFLRGDNISDNVSPKLVDGNLLLLDESTRTIYACMNYNQQSLNELQPAVLMDANQFM